MMLETMMALALVGRAQPEPDRREAEPTRQAVSAQFTSYAAAFTTFVDETATMPEKERVRLFRARFNELFHGFYQPNGRTEARYDASVAAALRDFPALLCGVSPRQEDRRHHVTDRNGASSRAKVKPLLEKALADYGTCQAPAKG